MVTRRFLAPVALNGAEIRIRRRIRGSNIFLSFAFLVMVIDFAVRAATPPKSGERRDNSWNDAHADFAKWRQKLRWPSGEAIRLGPNRKGEIDFGACRPPRRRLREARQPFRLAQFLREASPLETISLGEMLAM